MKNTILVLSLLFFGLQTMVAQDREEGSSFKDKTWYGSHVALGFGASSLQTDFNIGISPMMGYRVMGPVSIGPRASVLYRHSRYRDFNGDVFQKFNLVDLGLGAFLRAEVYRQYFVQAELMYESLDQAFSDGSKTKINGMNAYIGAGMNAGGANPSVELMLMYDLNLQSILKNNLINARFGFTIYY